MFYEYIFHDLVFYQIIQTCIDCFPKDRATWHNILSEPNFLTLDFGRAQLIDTISGQSPAT